MRFTKGVYDFLKNTALLYLPALGSFYFVMAGIWHLPNPDEVVASIVAFDGLLGALLKISTVNYNKTAKFDGAMLVTENAEGKKLVSLELEDDPHELEKKSEVTFKVVKA